MNNKKELLVEILPREYLYGGKYIPHIINSDGVFLTFVSIIETIHQKILDDMVENFITTVRPQENEFIVYTSVQPHVGIDYIDLNFTIEPNGPKFE